MLPYTAAMYQQAAALSNPPQGPPTPMNSMQLASLNLRYGFGAIQSAGPGLGHASNAAGVMSSNPAHNGSPVAAGYPAALFQQTAFDPMTLAAAGFRHAFDPRTGRFLPPEEPKPQHSYIGLIAMAILSVPDKKMVLSDIYQWILDHYPYFRTRGPGWRNSIRHNLSLNDCFIKAGRSANGKGHYWAIHPANVEDFKKGDFRRRRAQRKVRKHMGLAVPDDEDDSDDSPCSSPAAITAQNFFLAPNGTALAHGNPAILPLPPVHPAAAMPQNLAVPKVASFVTEQKAVTVEESKEKDGQPQPKRKRLFDMESLLSGTQPEKRALDCNGNGQSAGSTTDQRNGSESEKNAQPPQLAMPNPFFFPPPLSHQGSASENGQLLAAMAAAAAAGFMPFTAFIPHPSAAGLPWLPCPPVLPPPGTLPSPGNPYFWPGLQNPTASPRPTSKTASTSNSPPSNGLVINGDSINGDSTMQQDKCQDSPSPQQDTAAQWQETFAKIMARSYQGRNLVKSASKSASCHQSPREKDEEDTQSKN